MVQCSSFIQIGSSLGHIIVRERYLIRILCWIVSGNGMFYSIFDSPSSPRTLPHTAATFRESPIIILRHISVTTPSKKSFTFTNCSPPCSLIPQFLPSLPKLVQACVLDHPEVYHRRPRYLST